MGMKQGREYRAVQDFSLVPRADTNTIALNMNSGTLGTTAGSF